MDHFSREFKAPPESLNNEKFNKYLTNFKVKFNDYVLRPSKYSLLKEVQRLNILKYEENKIPFKKINTIKNKDFRQYNL